MYRSLLKNKNKGFKTEYNHNNISCLNINTVLITMRQIHILLPTSNTSSNKSIKIYFKHRNMRYLNKMLYSVMWSL